MTLDGAATGYWVQHCGHPTAVRPYYAVNSRGEYVTLRKFRLLADAKAAAVAAFQEAQQ